MCEMKGLQKSSHIRLYQISTFSYRFFTNNQIKWDLWDSVVCLNQWAGVSSNVKIGETVLVHFFIRDKSDLRYAVYHTSQRKNGRTMGPRYRKGRFKHIYSYEWQLTKDIVILCIHHILDSIQWDSNCMSLAWLMQHKLWAVEHDLKRGKRTRLAKKVMNDASKLDFHVTLLKRVSRKDTKSHYQPIVWVFRPEIHLVNK